MLIEIASLRIEAEKAGACAKDLFIGTDRALSGLFLQAKTPRRAELLALPAFVVKLEEATRKVRTHFDAVNAAYRLTE